MNNNPLGDREDYVLQKTSSMSEDLYPGATVAVKGEKNQASQKYEDTVRGVKSINQKHMLQRNWV